jgi:hypothetical protein
MKSEKKDYLKHWRVVRYFVKAKWGLSQADLDMLLFLYSERYFTREKFADYSKTMHWETKRFHRLMAEGWIDRVRIHTTKRKSLYNLSYKAQRVIFEIYNKLEGKEPLPETYSNNPIFKQSAGYISRAYRPLVKNMNESIQQQQRPSLE